MVAKSEASMPMSRALAKLAVATDLGTAARPSTSAPMFGAAGHGVGGGGSMGGGGGSKTGLATAGSSARSLLLKPCAARAVLAAMPLAALENAISGPSHPGHLPPQQPAPAPAPGPAPPPAPTTPRLPPLSPTGATAGGGGTGGGVPAAGRGSNSSCGVGAGGGGAQANGHSQSQPLPNAVSGERPGRRAATQGQPLSSPAGTTKAHPQPAQPRHPQQQQQQQQQAQQHQQQQQHHSPARLPLPLLQHHTAAPHNSNGAAAGSDFGRELLDAAKKHPGLPASLLAQLHRPRGRAGGAAGACAPASAPPGGPAATHGTVFALPHSNGPGFAAAASGPATDSAPPKSANGQPSTASIRPLSPRARARATATLTAAAATAASSPAPAAGPGLGPSKPSPPPPAALASLSPEALAVLWSREPAGPPPGSVGGSLLVMRRSAPVVTGAGAPLRPSTSFGPAAGPAAGAAASEMPVAPPRPHVVPHITVPYKPGSIRLPPAAAAALAAAAASAGPQDSRPGTAATSASLGGGGGQPGGSATGDLARPWTSAGGAPRPITANPLTHSMDPDPTASLVVRIPRSKTAAAGAGVAGGGPLAAPPPGAAAAMAGPGAGAGAGYRGVPAPLPTSYSAPATAGAAVGAAARTVEPVDGTGSVVLGGAPSRKLTDEELRAVVAAVAAARPEAAALLRQRPPTATAADTAGRPGTTTNGRRPPTSGGAPEDAVRRSLSAAGDAGPPGSAPYTPGGARPSSRCDSRGGLGSRGGTAAYDDVWPAPQSPRTPGGSSGRDGGGGAAGARPGSSAGRPGSGAAAAAGAAGAAAAAAAAGSGRPGVISAWGSRRRPQLQSIPENSELLGEDWAEEEGGGDESGGGRAGGGVGAGRPGPLAPLEPLEADPELDVAWANIVAANLRPDTSALKAATGSIDVFSRPVTGAPRIARQAAPMVLVLEDITASTPEVLERELAGMSLHELQAIKSRLGG